jgi:flagellar basal-body rod protein FlgC
LASWTDEPTASPAGVRATTFVAQGGQGTKVYEPGHPDADADGYVTMPDVDPIEETVNILSAARSFEANATAFNTAKEMLRSAIGLGNS